MYNLSMAFSPHDDNTAYLGSFPALTLPALVVGAALCGPAIDAFGFKPVTAVSLALGLVAVTLAVFRLPEPRYSLAGKRKP